jgi:hypothetical protein
MVISFPTLNTAEWLQTRFSLRVPVSLAIPNGSTPKPNYLQRVNSCIYDGHFMQKKSSIQTNTYYGSENSWLIFNQEARTVASYFILKMVSLHSFRSNNDRQKNIQNITSTVSSPCLVYSYSIIISCTRTCIHYITFLELILSTGYQQDSIVIPTGKKRFGTLI